MSTALADPGVIAGAGPRPLRSLLVRVALKAIVLIGLISATAIAGPIGSRASFLLPQGMSLSYLSRNLSDNWRRSLEEALLRNGDTHIYLYTQNQGDGVGGVLPQEDWEARLDHLNRIGLRPVFWLMADDSPRLSNQSLLKLKAHNAEIVRRFDSKVDHYVACLECDEYWTADRVGQMVIHLKNQTEKPVGVHLTPGVKPEYYQEADLIYLQTGFNLSEPQYRAKVRQALGLGKPVVVAEYAWNSSSSNARRLGDIACEMGAIGTGNGRKVDSCGDD